MSFYFHHNLDVLGTWNFVHYCIIVLYCFDGVIIAAQCTETFLRSIVLPRI